MTDLVRLTPEAVATLILWIAGLTLLATLAGLGITWWTATSNRVEQILRDANPDIHLNMMVLPKPHEGNVIDIEVVLFTAREAYDVELSLSWHKEPFARMRWVNGRVDPNVGRHVARLPSEDAIRVTPVDDPCLRLRYSDRFQRRYCKVYELAQKGRWNNGYDVEQKNAAPRLQAPSLDMRTVWRWRHER